MAAIRLAGAAGRMLFERYNRDEADSLIETAPRLTAPNSFPREHLRIVQLGRAFTGIHFADARWVWEAAKRLDEFVGRWKAGGHKSPLTRIPSDIAIETGWKHADYKVFAALCALNAAIGSKPYAVVTRNRIRAGMLGYSSGTLLFDEGGRLSEAGRHMLALRQDGAAEALTGDKVRSLLDKLVVRGLVKRFHPYKGSLVYFSKFMEPEAIATALVNRAERTTHNPKLAELGQRLRAVRSAAPLRGEQSPHNWESPHNENSPTTSPPSPHPVPTQAPHNASSNASLNASLNAGSEPAGHEAIAARQTFRAPTLTETEAFFEELKTHGGMQAGKWFDENGLDERWASPSLETSGTSLGGGSRANIWAKTPQA